MLTIVVPMGGGGQRFVDHGYTFPKPLVEIDGRPMIELVVENLRPQEEHRFVFVCRKDHLAKYALADVLRVLSPGSVVVRMDGPTAGALCSVLLGLQSVDPDGELLVANADQVVSASVDGFLGEARSQEVDGAIIVFPSTHPKWSYVRVEDGLVVAAAEKRPISSLATAGLYYFARVGTFWSAAEGMLLKNASVRSEFYVCPVYNEMILAGKRVTTYAIGREQMHSLGTPEDVERYAGRLSRQHGESGV